MSEVAFASRPMGKRRQAELRAKYCKRQASILWTKKRFITPELLPFVFGDGKLILAVRPIITRREHFIVAISSTFGKRDIGRSVHDIIDDIYEVHEEHFGPCGCVECGGDEADHNDGQIRFDQWPVICLNGGCEWWELK